MAGFIRLVAHTPELQAYTASKLYSALHSDISQESLTLAAVWIIGEYGEALIASGLVEEEEAKTVRFTIFATIPNANQPPSLGDRHRYRRSNGNCPQLAIHQQLVPSVRPDGYYEASRPVIHFNGSTRPHMRDPWKLCHQSSLGNPAACCGVHQLV